MAKAAWCTVAPMTGTGNKTISISAGAHTGRSVRNTTVMVQNQSGTKPSKEITVTQAAKVLSLLKVSGPTPASIAAAGGIVVITGTSNAKSINIWEDNDRMSAHEFKVNSVVQTDSRGDVVSPLFKIAGDPGATNEYTFESKITLPSNPNAEAGVFGIEFRGYSTDDESGTPISFRITISQAGAISTLSTGTASISLVNGGTAQNVAVTSNDKWIVS